MEATIGGNTYITGKLSTFDQLHVARKLAPLLGVVAALAKNGSLGQLKGLLPSKPVPGQKEPQGLSVEAVAGLIEPLTKVFAEMTDEQVESTLGKCLAVVRRKLAGDLGSTPIWNAGAGGLQFEDINLPSMIQLVALVIQENVGGFLQGLPELSQTRVG